MLHDLDHPHIVRVLDVLDDGEGVAIVMAFAPGGTLADLRQDRGALSAGEVVAVVAPLADALASAHRRQVLHGDVKPANVLFTSDGEPLLADFGAQRGGAGVEVTPTYAAPEVLAGRPAEPPSDVYSLAAVAVELLTGEVPAAARLDAAADGSAALVALLRAALSAEPDDRPTAAQLATELRGSLPAADVRLPGPARAVGAASPATRSFGPSPERSDRSAVRRRAPWLLGAAALLGVGTLFVVTRGDDAGCPEVRIDPAAGAQSATGDFDGDGCPSAAAYTGQGPGGVGILRVDRGSGAPLEVAVGGPDDLLYVGDWDCDGSDRPALYRPADGTVVYLEDLEVGAAATAVGLADPGQEVVVRRRRRRLRRARAAVTPGMGSYAER